MTSPVKWQTDRAFWTRTVICALVLIGIVDCQMLRGRVPFPSFFLFEFGAFAKFGPQQPLQVPANISDVAISFYPYHGITSQAVHDHEIPLWNPYMLSGAPLLASAQAGIFYPPNIVYYLLPLPVAWSLSFVLRTLLAVVLTAWFVREIGGSIAGSIAAGVLFAFCAFLTVWQGQAMSDASIWLPLVCLAVVRLESKVTAKTVFLTAVAFAMPVLAGHPETAFHVTLAGVMLFVFLAISRRSGKFVMWFTVSGLLAIGIASIQLFPTLEWLKYLSRSLHESWPPQPLWSVLGWVSRDILHSENSFGLQVPEQAAYIGMLAFAAFPLACLHQSRRIAIFFFICATSVLSIAYGVGPLFWLAQHLPVIQSMRHSRLIFVAAFSLAVLAGLGVSTVEEWDALRPIKERMEALLLVVIGCSLAMTLILSLRQVTIAMSEPSRYPRVSAAFLGLSAVVLALRILGRLRPAVFAAAVLVIVSLDCVSFSYGFMPFTEPEYLFPKIALFERLPKLEPEPFRIAQTGAAYIENAHAMYGLASAGGYEITLRRTKDFLGGLTTDEVSAINFITSQAAAVQDRRLDMLNIKYWLVSEWDPDYMKFAEQSDHFTLRYSTDDVGVFENLRVLPAAFVTPLNGVEWIPDDRAALQRIESVSFDPLKSVVLPQRLDVTADSGPPNQPDVQPDHLNSSVEWIARHSNSFELRVRTPAAGVLIVGQAFYPGWTAFVDGARTPVFQADYALTGIAIPAGTHAIHFQFQPLSFTIGWIVSAATLGGLCAVVFL